MFFRLAAENRFKRAFLADKNPELVKLYEVIQGNVQELIALLRDIESSYHRLKPEDRSAEFYRVRRQQTDTLEPVERAARFLFLNRTCFNGLWRVNASGQFNVPFGKYAKPRILDVDVLESANRALARATIIQGDFEKALGDLKKGDFAYFDPPYVPVSKTANFTAYAADPFGPKEQHRLLEQMLKLKKLGVNAMLSNAASDELRKTYRQHGLVVSTIKAGRSINSNPSKRGAVEELVVTTYKREPVAASASPGPARQKRAG